MIDVYCYALLAAAWIVDLLTPQLFVAAVLLNGPIALSAQALRPSLTIRLTVLAEIANVIAGYVNGVQAGGHWDAIAIGDRILAGATFVLVAGLTLRAQESARRAGESAERDRQFQNERALRHAMETVRASLNMELVLRSAVAEALKITRADRVEIVTRDSALAVPLRFEMHAGDRDARVWREVLSPELGSVVERARGMEGVLAVSAGDPIGRMLGESALVTTSVDEGAETIFVAAWKEGAPDAEQRLDVQAFFRNLEVALQQARTFLRLADQHEQIARQRNALQERSDVIRDIVYALAHDLRTPIAAADVTMTQALSGAYGELPDQYREILRAGVASNAGLRRLVESLLLVARYESGEDSRRYERISVNGIAQRVLSELRPVAELSGVELTLSQTQEAWAMVDGDEIRRAVANLLANAIEATPKGGHVQVTVKIAMGRVSVLVADDGYGVPPERRASLFQRFAGFRAGAGTGLGLYIVRRIAEKYGGAAQYRPREPRGSCFTIEIPALETA
ncbi:MAG: sensor histidine kinase [Vulcanimicrobiaceae bacterium]